MSGFLKTKEGSHTGGILFSLIMDISNWQKIALFLTNEINDNIGRSHFLASNFSDAGKHCFARRSTIYTKGLKGHSCAVIIWGKKSKEFRGKFNMLISSLLSLPPDLPKKKLCFLFYSKLAASFLTEIMVATKKDPKLNKYREVNNNKVSIEF